MLTIEELLKQSKTGAASDGLSTNTKSNDDALTLKMKEIELKRLESEKEAEAKALGLPYQNLLSFPISQEAISQIPEIEARQNKVIAFYVAGQEIKLGTTELTPEINTMVERFTTEKKLKASVSLISEASLNKGLAIYALIPKLSHVEGGVQITAEELTRYQSQFKSFKELEAGLLKANLTEIVSMMLASALSSRCSDIHIEAEEKGIKIRFRIDGVLQTVAYLPPELWKQVISRIKLLSKLKLNVSSEPQDGRFAIFLTNETVDLRVSTLPTSWGESVVMRILKSSAAALPFDQLGLVGKASKDLDTQINRPNGMIITTGPTGSGKTTTLYAILNHLNDNETKIITLEDPVEYKLKGINQSQIEQPKIGLNAEDAKDRYTFAKGLKAILRQDPDVIMVGEIRDLETADVAINAALTGHLMISTLHTNSAAGAIPRFLAMGVQPFMLAPALNAIIGQRLVRRICQKCKHEDSTVTPEQMTRIADYLKAIPEKSGQKLASLDNLKFYAADGCEACNGLGYKGRIGIYEVLAMSKGIEEIILSGKVSEYSMQEIAVNEGMVTMVQDGLLKALNGLTTIAEVFKVAE